MMVLNSEKGNAKRLASRVASSATCLVKNVIGCSTADELPALLASGSGLGSKASDASSSNSTSKWMEGLPTHASQSIYGHPESCYGSFRSASEERAQGDEFEAFMSSCTLVSAGFETSAPAFSIPPPVPADETEQVDFEGKLPMYSQEISQSTFDWNAVWDSHRYGLWAPDILTTTQLHNLKREDVRSMLASTAQIEDHATFRLRLILGHIIGIVPSIPSVHQHQSVVQRPQDAIVQEKFLTTGAASRHSYLDQMLSASASTTTHVFQHENSTASGQRDIHESHHQPITLHNSKTDRDVTKTRTTPTFHCSWILCRKRFNNASQFRKYTTGNSPFDCPHEHCTAQFQSLGEWADHIARPHHNRQHSIRRPIAARLSILPHRVGT